MDLTEAKDIVRQMFAGSVTATRSLPDSHLHGEAIKIVYIAANAGDREAIGVQTCIPEEMHYVGLYPNVQTKHNIKPDFRHINIKILCQNILNNPKDFTPEELEHWFDKYADQKMQIKELRSN